ncbi:MAG: hypothetical protein ACLRZH_05820 [Ruthenibacterium lactatiformans]
MPFITEAVKHETMHHMRVFGSDGGVRDGRHTDTGTRSRQPRIAVLDVGTTAETCLSPLAGTLACSVQEYALRTQGERVSRRGAVQSRRASGLADALSQAPGCIPAAVSITTRRNAHARGPFGRAASPFLVADSRAE